MCGAACARRARSNAVLCAMRPGVFLRRAARAGKIRGNDSVTKEMTHGSPMKLILGFSIPLFFGNIFQQFYSMVDTIIVGRVLGTGPLAAVGLFLHLI